MPPARGRAAAAVTTEGKSPAAAIEGKSPTSERRSPDATRRPDAARRPVAARRRRYSSSIPAFSPVILPPKMKRVLMCFFGAKWQSCINVSKLEVGEGVLD
ncbi:uncharacterized protein [Triticum aestivum]|uniref:uncharacterized protein n=1 Tax=Triticum aestivum TaxID=4565 RepID=UPI001D016D43|nr:uncharacterized protein LOC123041402 [Triticum aestivum]